MLTKISNYSISNQDASALMVTEDTQRIGLMRFIMLNQSNTATPGMMLGSIVEVNGALFRNITADEVCTYHDASGNEYPATSAPDGTLYIVMIPDDNSCKCVLKTLTTTGKYFDNVRCGYYETATQNRVIGSCVKSGSSFSKKRLYTFNDPVADNSIQIYQDGVIIPACTINGYASGETDSKSLLTSQLVWDAPLQSNTIEITHPCKCRIVTNISAEGNNDHNYRYYYNVAFKSNYLGIVKASTDNFQFVTIGHSSDSSQAVAYAELTPGIYTISHQFVRREMSTGGGWTILNAGTLWMTSTIYVGDVFGSLTGKIF